MTNKVKIFICRYHEILNPISRHMVSSYSTCRYLKEVSLEELEFLGENLLNTLQRNLELDITEPELVLKIIDSEIGGDEYVKLSLRG